MGHDRTVPPEPRTVRVVVARSTEAATVTDLLDAGERTRLAGLNRQVDRDAWASAHALLRLVLGATLDRDPAALVLTATCRTCGGGHGRPELAGQPGVHLGLSHAPGLVAVAVGTVGPLGVDVEAVAATGFTGFAEVALAPGERAVTTTERARTWVRKESLLKATGLGLSVPPSTVRLSDPGAPPRLLAWNAGTPPGPVRLHDVAVGAEHAAAVAVLGRAPWTLRVREHRW